MLVTKLHYANYTHVSCPSLAGLSNLHYILGMRHSALTRLCGCAPFVLWLNCEVLIHDYCPGPCVQYPDGRMGLVVGEWVGGY